MKNRILSLIIFVMIISLLAGCGGNTAPAAEKNIVENSAEPAETDITAEEKEVSYFSDRDFDAGYDEAAATKLELREKTLIESEGTYILSGQIDDGMVIINAENTDKVQLVLDNVSINSSSSAAIYVKQADKVFITLAEGSENKLSNGGSFKNIDDSNIDAVIYSKDDVTINGSGSLAINSPAGHGIIAKDSLCITGGSFDIFAASNGLEGQDEVCIAGGSFAISAEKDAIQADMDEDASLGNVYIAGGSFTIDAGDDGISATGYVLIDDGALEISCGGGSVNSVNEQPQGMMRLQPEGMMGGGRGKGPGGNTPPDRPTMDSSSDSMRGIKADGDIIINGGSFVLDVAGDALHANMQLCINAGDFDIYAGDDGLNADDAIIVNGGRIKVLAYGDGLDSNGSVEVLGGSLEICGPLQGDTATLDFESSAVIRGGSFFGTGSNSMARTFTAAEQGVISLSVGRQSAGTEIKVSDSAGDILISFTPELDYCVAILSSPELVPGESYTVTVGSESGEFKA